MDLKSALGIFKSFSAIEDKTHWPQASI